MKQSKTRARRKQELGRKLLGYSVVTGGALALAAPAADAMLVFVDFDDVGGPGDLVVLANAGPSDVVGHAGDNLNLPGIFAGANLSFAVYASTFTTTVTTTTPGGGSNIFPGAQVTYTGASAFDTNGSAPTAGIGADLSLYPLNVTGNAATHAGASAGNFASLTSFGTLGAFLRLDLQPFTGTDPGGTQGTFSYSWGNFVGTDGLLPVRFDDGGGNTEDRWLYVDLSAGLRIHGYWYDDQVVPPAPEPGTLAMLAMGAAGLGLWRRRGKKTGRKSLTA